jgi:uncharacterized protein (TIGR03000 family)
MFRRLLARVGTAVLAAGVALGTAGTADAQHHGGGHAGGGHAGGHIGGGHIGGGHIGGGHAVIPHAGGSRVVIPHATFGGAHHGGVGTTFGRTFGGQSFHRGGVGTNYYHNYGHAYRNYGGHNYYRGGYGRYGYYPYSGFGLGLALGSLGYGYPWGYGSGYSYPYDFGSYTYPYYYPDSTYYAPGYVENDVTVTPSQSYYPPAEPAVATSATLTVQLPADAKLWIDGQPTTQTGPVRTFQTPTNLEPGRTYSYKLTAEWVENGQTVTREREITFQPGNQAVVNMTVP